MGYNGLSKILNSSNFSAEIIDNNIDDTEVCGVDLEGQSPFENN